MRLAAGVEYDGTRFFGWQRQRQSPTVQASVEAALARVADHPVTVHCAGRTDTGVHARCQVIHFETEAERSERSWVLGANTVLHEGATLLWVRQVDDRFHARFSATRRRYRYRILNRWVRPAIELGRMSWIRHPLDAGRMHEAAQALLGEHDFSSFRARGCQAKSPVRTVHSVAVSRSGCEVRIDIEANAFVYHMVRNIAGALIAVGDDRRPISWIESLLEARDRTQAGITAPADGLTFMYPTYPDFPELPIREEVGFPGEETVADR
ncbi:tRNA pseudouridine(38-40) synthase TruA [Wenzhouxiangella marina]|uniref:tRNA pseudouridine synthase A n=1 Tax=Wenzhouxiangella marina TaxID=1579979 RepID=A0A0K0XXQ2_9GAMM|nr:tRNA pseudouridine(38-40) synthase TruA [Wenzhouxiangella marina]AKS42412.1 tRNA pseudouridine synthase A [Wenzhouxiangella marina]MBB6085814.1 tRNA pseudouridine38-40 synthase [Wenzhouxiangella marina]